MSILEPALAQKFIEKTAKHLEYNINIMNDKGIIIASKDATRVGNFHEVAYSMLEGTRDSGIVTEDQVFLGTKPGVNLFIDYKNKHVGVICVTGNPENVHAFANLVKTSMEAMLEYELHMESERKRKGKAEQLLYYALFEDQVDPAIMSRMCDRAEINKEVARVCVLIKPDPLYKTSRVIEALTRADGFNNNDLIAIARNDDVILFKSIAIQVDEAVKTYKKVLDKYIQNFYQELPSDFNKDVIKVYIGTLQNHIHKYRDSYIHAQDLSMQARGLNNIVYFNDRVLNYYRNQATIKAYDEVFNIYEDVFSRDERKQLIEIANALRNNNYNVVYSAKELFIHRNTMLFRLNKIKETLNIDPISNPSDREFFSELAYYFNNKLK